ncbi:hypothetical protein [Photorhabdus australis]|uniref:hypothetical protein n=1 Tax=Photorhabdus australis TaxID=286156 RepID=UPI00055FF8A5|nr:hypothetical protein [Photorhabdus australis]
MLNHKKLLAILLFILPITGLSKENENFMNNKIEPIDYRLEIEVNKCSIELFINGMRILSYYDKEPMNTLIGIGEYLKPKNNTIQFYTWPSNRKKDIFDSGSKCNFTLEARNRFETPDLKPVMSIKYNPNDNIEHNTSNSSLEINSINEQLARLLGRNKINHNNEKYYYEYSQQFDIKNDYPVWNWVNSYQFSKENNVIDSLPEKYQSALISAYKEYWAFLKSKDIKGLKQLHKEFLDESVRANGGNNDDYFSSIGLDEIINSPDLQLLPLDFNQSKIDISLDGRVVFMSPSPLVFINKNNRKNKTLLNPKYRFDGNRFILTR